MTTIQNEFDKFIKSVYPNVKLAAPQLRDLKQAYTAGMITVVVMRKERAKESGVEFLDEHINSLSKEIIDFGNAICAENLRSN